MERFRLVISHISEIPARPAAARRLNQSLSITDAEAEMRLDAIQKHMSRAALDSFSVADQLMIAADIKPRRFRTKWQQVCYEGPTARKDAESAERVRWLSLVADLLRNTDTPMGRLLRENPANSQLLGGGRRGGTLRSRVRAIKKFLRWLAAAHNVEFPTHWKHLVEYLQVRLSEPCVRGSLKLVHASFVFFQEIAGVQDRLTDAAFARCLPKRITCICSSTEASATGSTLLNDTSGSV